MGIRFLQTFLCNDVPDGFFQVNIGQEIQKWRKYNFHHSFTTKLNCLKMFIILRQNNGRAVIVFDVMGLLNITLQSNIDLVLGGRHHIMLSKYEEFFLKLKSDYDAELVFFCDGLVQQVTIRYVRVRVERNATHWRKSRFLKVNRKDSLRSCECYQHSGDQ